MDARISAYYQLHDEFIVVRIKNKHFINMKLYICGKKQVKGVPLLIDSFIMFLLHLKRLQKKL